MHTQSYVHIYIYTYMVPPRYLPFLYFYWYLRGFATDLHGWSLALVSRGGTGTIYIFICICFFFSNSVARMVFSLIELNFKDSILGRMH